MLRTPSARPRCALRRVRSYHPGLEGLEDRVTPTTLPPGFAETLVASGFSNPTAMEFAPDGRLFVTEQGGTLRVVDHGVLPPTPFLTVPVITFREDGLESVTLDPHFAQNGFVYVYYTHPVGARAFNRPSRFTADPGNPNVALPTSEVVLLDGIRSPTGHHNGGALHFGLDGKLYLGIGDGGTGGATAQALGSPYGKILRLDPDGPLLFPLDNPFVRLGRRAFPGLFALGLRNPYTAAVDPATGLLFVNDVGENTWEEVDLILPGKNYGWPLVEGPQPRLGLRGPLFAYSHFLQNGSRDSAITGGVFYRGSRFPALLQGKYFFADFAKGFIRMLDPAHPRLAFYFAFAADSPVDLDMGPDGRLYFLSINSGTVQVIDVAG